MSKRMITSLLFLAVLLWGGSAFGLQGSGILGNLLLGLLTWLAAAQLASWFFAPTDD